MIEFQKRNKHFNKQQSIPPISIIDSSQIFNFFSVTLRLRIDMKISECKSSVCRTCGLDPKFSSQVSQRYEWVIDRKITFSSVLQFRIRIPVTFKVPVKYTKVVIESVIVCLLALVFVM